MPKLLTTFLISITVFMLIVGCTKKPSNYYRHISINAKYAIIGKYPIDDEMANKVNCYHFIYNDKGRLKKIEYLKGGRLSNDPYFGISQVRIESLKGYEKWTYLDAKEQLMPSNKKVYSIRLKLDGDNNPLALFNYDKEGNLSEDRNGVAQYLWTLDKKGRRIKSIRVNKGGNRIVDDMGIYEKRWEWNTDDGTLFEESNFDANGQLLEGKNNVAIIRTKYDDHRNLIEKKYYGTNGQLKDNNNGLAIAHWKYDEYGNTSEQTNFGIDEQLKENQDGVAIFHWKHDKYGNVTERRHYGNDKQLKDDNKFGYAIMHWKYDEYGNMIEIRAYNNDERLKENNDGYAIIRDQYNEYNNILETKFFDAKEELTNVKKTGVAIISYIYNKKGTLVRTKYLSKNGALITEHNQFGK